MTEVCKAIYERGMCPVLWDVQDAGSYDRNTCKFYDDQLLAELQRVEAETVRENLAID